MTADAPLAADFEAERPRLLGMAYRMLGSLAEAEDAVQDAWLRLGRAEVDAIENLGGWLTTALARLCLDRLRARTARREESLEATDPDMGPADDRADPERELALADETGVALLVVLDQLAPAERVAFVLRVDPVLLRGGLAGQVRGARAVSKRALGFPRQARTTGLALVDGAWAIVAAEHGRLTGAVLLHAENGRISAIEVIAEPDRLAALDIRRPAEM